MKATLSEINKNPQGTNSERKEAGIKINNLEHKEEINTQPEPNEETRIQRTVGQYKKTLGRLQMCQHPNHKDARRRRGRARN